MMEDLQPTWLDESFVKEVLKSVEGLSGEQQISISRWQCNNAVPPGIIYLSLLYRLTVDYKIENQNRSTTVIITTPLESGLMKKHVEKVDGYGRELKMYREVFPRMYEIAGNCKMVSARSYDCPLHNSIVLEDLSELGYTMADRLKQLDAAHCRQFLISLAKFHGLSVAVIHKDPHLIKSVAMYPNFDGNKGEEDKKQHECFTKCNLTGLVTRVESMGLERYAEIIRGKIDSFYETMVTLFKPSGELRVLNHGQCWTNNALFKYNNSGEVVDAKLVNFQNIQIGSFAGDVIHFWWTSARQEVREHLQEELFEVYRKTLNQTLEDVQVSERVSKQEFDNEIKRFSPYSLSICCTVMIVTMADPELFTEDLHSSKNFGLLKYYKAILPDLLGQLERFGAFT